MASVDFINECKNRTNANRLGKIVVNDTTNKEITNNDNLQSFNIDSGCYVDGNIIGSIYIKCLNAQFISVPSDVNLIDKNINAYVGVKYDDLSDEYINMGKYVIERPNNEETADFTQIKAYSNIRNKIDEKYICGIVYSEGNKTLKDLYIDICDNLQLIPVTTTFINGDIPIVSNPFTNGETNRTVLQTVAKISCSFIDINDDTNEIDLKWLSDNIEPDYTFLKSDYVTLEGGQIQYGPINSLIIKNSQIDSENVSIDDSESIELNGENSIVISEDYILHNSELRNQAITAIWNRIHNLKYTDCKLTTYYGKPFLKLGNKIRIYTSDIDYIDSYVLKHKFTFDGTFESVIESPALTKQEIKTKQNISLKEVLYKTQIDVDKQNKRITATVEQVDGQQTNINNIQIDINSMKQEISKIDGIEERTNTVETTIDGMKQTIKYSGGYNLFDNIHKQFGQNNWNGTFDNFINDETIKNCISESVLRFKNNIEKREKIVPNGTYNFSCNYKKLINLANCYIKINDYQINLNETDWTEIEYTFFVNSNAIQIEFYGDTIDCLWMGDILFIPGDVKQIWTPNPNEVYTDEYELGGGKFKLKSSDKNVYFEASPNGIKTKNKITEEITSEFTDDGMYNKKSRSDEAEIARISIRNIGNQTIFNRF